MSNVSFEEAEETIPPILTIAEIKKLGVDYIEVDFYPFNNDHNYRAYVQLYLTHLIMLFGCRKR